MSVSLITSLVGTALNLSEAAKQKRLAEQAQRQADIDTEKAFKAIERSKILDLELPMNEYRRQAQLIEQQTRQAVEAAREAGPRGVAAIPRIQQAGIEGFESLTGMKERALIGLQNLAEQQRVRGERDEALLREKSAIGDGTAARDYRMKSNALKTAGLKSLAGTIGGLTAFDPDKAPYPGEGGLDAFLKGIFGGQAEGSQEGLDASTKGRIDMYFKQQQGKTPGSAEAFLDRPDGQIETLGDTKFGAFLGSIPDFLGNIPDFLGNVPSFLGGLFNRQGK